MPDPGATSAPVNNASNLPVRPITFDVETQAFWEATTRRILSVPKCRSCELVFWYPRGICPECGSLDIEWTEAAGTGTIYSFSVTRNGQGVWKGVAPYVLAYVELDEGVRILTNIVNCDVETVRIGQRVSVVWDQCDVAAESGPAIYRFEITE